MALPIGPFPFTLTNGTLADANQVMANFNLLLNGVNGLAPLAQAIVGSGSSNVRASLATAGTSVTFTADNVTVGTALNGTLYTLTSYSQVFNGGTTGAGGMDTGTLPVSGYVAIYAIYNPAAPTVSILGTNANVSSPTIYSGANMPAGYTASALLGVWPTNATPALTIGYARGKKLWASRPSNTASGTVTIYTSLSIASQVPPAAISYFGTMWVNVGTTPGGSNNFVSVAADINGTSVQTVEANAASVSNAIIEGQIVDQVITTSQTTFWGSAIGGTSGSTNLIIGGYSIP